MSVKIVFESHSTTFDNENKIASGWYDADLSPLGLTQGAQLGDRRRDQGFDAVFCADQQRAYKSAAIAFADTNIPVFVDSRLRECNYGDLNQGEKSLVDGQRLERINTPYPNGESYMQTRDRMFAFLEYLKKNFDGKKVLIIGARATQFGIQNYIEKTPYEELVTAKFTWQPGWDYEL
ncbi:MAG: histidine phosphatase family protein [Rickettsiales bacterium]|jgi:broad specificity phosphatase PhoE|nr:histidine phosphatase family protein [Rickettsiales bacterium]